MNGSISYDKEGNTAYAIYNEKYCVEKEYSGQSTIKDYDENCGYIAHPDDKCFTLQIYDDNETASITDYLCSYKKIIIPEKINRVKIVTIGANVFANNQLTSVIIPNSVTSIGNAAFNNNQLPDVQAFIYKRNSDGSIDNTKIVSYGGAKRDNVEIPSSVTNIEGSAFRYNQLTSVTIKGKSSTSDFTSYGSSVSVFDWAFGYSDANIYFVNE